jgi:lipid-binding SYLF domain-containing protein
MQGSSTSHYPLCLAVVLAIAGCATPAGETARQERAAINELCDETLWELYQRRPTARAKVEAAAGYAVFSEIDIKIPLKPLGDGYGIVVDNQNGRRTFMRMAQVDGGPRFGVKRFRGVFVFRNESTLRKFVDQGWQFTGQVGAEAKASDVDIAVTADARLEDLQVYRFTDAGIALQATVSGTRYWKQAGLN